MLCKGGCKQYLVIPSTHPFHSVSEVPLLSLYSIGYYQHAIICEGFFSESSWSAGKIFKQCGVLSVFPQDFAIYAIDVRGHSKNCKDMSTSPWASVEFKAPWQDLGRRNFFCHVSWVMSVRLLREAWGAYVRREVNMIRGNKRCPSSQRTQFRKWAMAGARGKLILICWCFY